MTKKTILRLVFILWIALGIACAPKGKKPEHAKMPPGSHEAPVGVGGEIKGEEVESPERKASNAVVEQGQSTFNRGLYDQAANSFQEAVTLDATNGAAYYWLALAKLRSGEYGEAEGLIEKAQTLLAGRSEWTDKLSDLQKEFQQNKPRD